MTVASFGVEVGISAGASTCARSKVRPIPATLGSRLLGNELLYGASPNPGSGITYQNGVVFIGGGASAIKKVSANGLIWTLNGSAPHVGELRPGSIMFASAFGAGRVLAISTVHGDKIVAIGPVALTDVIKNGDISTPSPTPLSGFEAYRTPGQPGLMTTTTSGSSSSGTSPHVIRLAPTELVALPPGQLRTDASPTIPTPADLPNLPGLPSPSSFLPTTYVGNYQLQSVCCADIGLHAYYVKGPAKFPATMSLRFTRPTIKFDLNIPNGRLVNASVDLNGAAGLLVNVEAAILNESGDFKGPRVEVPLDITIPISAGGLPLIVGIQQIFSLGLALSGRASLKASGEYRLGGALGFAIKNGVPIVSKPTLSVSKSIIDSLQVDSVGPLGLDVAYAVKLTIGVGTYGFSAGAWYQLSAAVGLTGSGPAGLVQCRSANLVIDGKYGVGYSVPTLVASAINVFLRAVFTHPVQVRPADGREWGPDTLFERATPSCAK